MTSRGPQQHEALAQLMTNKASRKVLVKHNATHIKTMSPPTTTTTVLWYQYQTGCNSIETRCEKGLGEIPFVQLRRSGASGGLLSGAPPHLHHMLLQRCGHTVMFELNFASWRLGCVQHTRRTPTAITALVGSTSAVSAQRAVKQDGRRDDTDTCPPLSGC